jgi:hypothetical protein
MIRRVGLLWFEKEIIRVEKQQREGRIAKEI